MEMNGVLWLIGIIGLILWIALAIDFARVAESKGYDNGYGFWVFFTGIFGMILVAALPDRGQNVTDNNKTSDKNRKSNKLHAAEEKEEGNADIEGRA